MMPLSMCRWPGWQSGLGCCKGSLMTLGLRCPARDKSVSQKRGYGWQKHQAAIFALPGNGMIFAPRCVAASCSPHQLNSSTRWVNRSLCTFQADNIGSAKDCLQSIAQLIPCLAFFIGVVVEQIYPVNFCADHMILAKVNHIAADF